MVIATKAAVIVILRVQLRVGEGRTRFASPHFAVEAALS
jgi:hypothetical protein